MRFLFPALLAALAAAPAAANEVFRTVDERGVVIYSDRPLSAASQRVRVDAAPASPAPVAEPDTFRGTAEAERRQQGAEVLTAGREEQAEILAEACRQAREAAEAYERAPRLYETLPDGGRRFLSDDEMVLARQQARQAVIDFCED